jgi:uncharacterized integral membrane protein
MKPLVWIIRIVLFVLLFALALRNTSDATLQLFFGTAWRAPLILILLACFGLGMLAGLLAMVPRLTRLRLEVNRLRKAAQARPAAETAMTTAPNPIASDLGAGMPYPMPGPKG